MYAYEGRGTGEVKNVLTKCVPKDEEQQQQLKVEEEEKVAES